MQKISILLEHWWVGGRRTLWMLLFCHKMSQACAYLVLTHLCGILGSETLLWLENTWICIFCWNKKNSAWFWQTLPNSQEKLGQTKALFGQRKGSIQAKERNLRIRFCKTFPIKGASRSDYGHMLTHPCETESTHGQKFPLSHSYDETSCLCHANECLVQCYAAFGIVFTFFWCSKSKTDWTSSWLSNSRLPAGW